MFLLYLNDDYQQGASNRNFEGGLGKKSVFTAKVCKTAITGCFTAWVRETRMARQASVLILCVAYVVRDPLPTPLFRYSEKFSRHLYFVELKAFRCTLFME